MKELKIRPLTEEERVYAYTQSRQLDRMTGNIGFLYGGFGSSGKEFSTLWTDQCERYKTDVFRTGLNEAVNVLRSREYGLLRNRTAMTEYVREHPESIFLEGDGMTAGFRVDKGEHAFLIRCEPARKEDNFECYCYVSEFLDRHMANARQGIRFVDPHYKELFRIPDGGKIVLMKPDGEQREKTCRFLDEYHTEISNWNYHICEFAEKMQKWGITFGPAGEKSMEKEQQEKAR